MTQEAARVSPGRGPGGGTFPRKRARPLPAGVASRTRTSNFSKRLRLENAAEATKPTKRDDPTKGTSMPHALLDEARQLERELVNIRRDLHRNPELGFRESRTAAVVAARLEALGLQVRRQVGVTGVVAELEN